VALQLIVRILETPLDIVAAPFEQVWQRSEVEWGVLDTAIRSVSSKMTGNWQQLKEFVSRQTNAQAISKTVVIIPGTQVLLTSVSLPGRGTRHLKQALPFLLEEQLASDIEDNFFAVGTKNSSSNQHPVVVVSHSKMAVWSELLSASEVNADIATPDVLLVPKNDSDWSLLVDQKLAWLRTGLHAGLCFDRIALPFILEAAVQQYCDAQDKGEDQEKLRIEWIEGGTSDQAPGSAPHSNPLEGSNIERQRLDLELDQLSEGQVHIAEARLESGLLESFSQAILEPGLEKRAINLLQGPYQVKRSRSDLGIKFRPLAILLTVWLGLVVAADVSQTKGLEQQSAQLKQQSVTLFQSYFPNEKGSVRLRQRMENYLNSAGEGAGVDATFLDLLAEAGAVLTSINSQEPDAKISIQRLSYDSKQSDLRIDIHAPDFASLENYKTALEAKNLQVDISSAVSKADRVEGRIKVFR